jgi:hypothetical protein
VSAASGSGRCGSRQAAPQHHAAAQQRPGLEPVHAAQLVFIERQADAGQVDRLTTGHAFIAGGTCQQAAQRGLHLGRRGTVVGRQQFEGQGLQCIAGQQGLRLAEAHVHRGFAAAQHIVVHARHVVVHQ